MDPKIAAEDIKLTTDLGLVAMVDDQTGFAFGPTFKNEWEAEGYIEYLLEEGIEDPRSLTVTEHQHHLMGFMS